MNQPVPAVYSDGDVRVEPHGRAIAVRVLNQPGMWAIISADQGMQYASQWQVDVIESWPAAPLRGPVDEHQGDGPDAGQ